MSVIRVTQRARDILEAGFPGLKGFADRFRAAETDYKRAASEKAQTWFSRSALETLIRDEHEALTKRVRDLGNRTRRSQKASCRATTSRRPPTRYERSHTRKVNLCIIQVKLSCTSDFLLPSSFLASRAGNKWRWKRRD